MGIWSGLVPVNRKVVYHGSDDEAAIVRLVRSCYPRTGVYRADAPTAARENPAVRSQVYAQLTPGQLALFMFRVLYDHAGNSAGDLYCWVSYLLSEANAWSAIKAGSRYFGDDAMLQLLEEIEGVLEARYQQGDVERRDALPWDLDDDPQLFASMNQLNATFHEIG